MKQATVKLPSGTYTIIGVPKGIPDNEDFGYEAGSAYNHIFVGGKQYEFHSRPIGILPPVSTGLNVSDWQLLGADPTALTEEEAGEIVEPLFTKDEIHKPRYHHELNLDPMPYKNYLWNTELDDGSCYSSFDTATASLSSLAQSLGIEKPFVILKNVEK